MTFTTATLNKASRCHIVDPVDSTLISVRHVEPARVWYHLRASHVSDLMELYLDLKKACIFRNDSICPIMWLSQGIKA